MQLGIYGIARSHLTEPTTDPVILVPVFNSNIGDGLRVFLITVVHTIMVEVTLLINRYTKTEICDDPNLVVQENASAFGSEITCELSFVIFIPLNLPEVFTVLTSTSSTFLAFSPLHRPSHAQ